jgi:hypothetical protein
VLQSAGRVEARAVAPLLSRAAARESRLSRESPAGLLHVRGQKLDSPQNPGVSS